MMASVTTCTTDLAEPNFLEYNIRLMIWFFMLNSEDNNCNRYTSSLAVDISVHFYWLVEQVLHVFLPFFQHSAI